MAAVPDETDAELDRRLTGPADPAATAAELAALRRLATQNMRLLKAQIVPLIDAALRASGGAAPGAEDHRRRWTETALRLIDDTAIAASAGAVCEPVSPVDFRALLDDAAGRYGNRIGPVALGAVPRLTGRGTQLRMLADELIAGIARIAPHALPGGLQVGRTVGGGVVMVWFRDGGLAPPDPGAQPPGPAGESRQCWSVCCNLMARMGGEFHLWQTGRGRLCLALQFPEDMVLEEGAD